ncbi:MAG: helix-turn-helix domain-containing protein [Promethearchaeia archaeon]
MTLKLSFLREIGFNDIQLKIYEYLLTHRFATINDIKKDVNYSYAQVYQNLRFLEKKGLIESSKTSKPIIYISKEPKIALMEIINKRYNDIKKDINKLDEELRIQESKFGRCLKDITFYHYSDIALAVNNFYGLIEKTKNEIIMTALPPLLLRKLEPSLFNAFFRGVNIRLYYSLRDFEEISNYFELLTNILKRIRIIIIQTKEKTCQTIRYNDKIVNAGNIILDEKYFNSIIFKENNIYHFEGFISPIAKQAKKYLEILTIIKKLEIQYPDPIKNILTAIELNGALKTRDISNKTKIGGTKLKKILDFLVNQGLIKEEIIQGNTGRPKKIYYLINPKFNDK